METDQKPDCRPKRTRGERLRDQAEIAAKFLDGWSHQQIADWLAANRPYRISRVMVTKEVGKAMDAWHREMLDSIDRHKTRELAKLRQRERQALECFERSKQDRTITEVRQDKDGKTVTKGKVTKESRDGNPAFLGIALQCAQLRCAILGIKAPAVTELSGPDGAPIPVQVSPEVPIAPEHLERTLLKALQEKHGGEAGQPASPAVEPGPNDKL